MVEYLILAMSGLVGAERGTGTLAGARKPRECGVNFPRLRHAHDALTLQFNTQAAYSGAGAGGRALAFRSRGRGAGQRGSRREISRCICTKVTPRHPGQRIVSAT